LLSKNNLYAKIIVFVSGFSLIGISILISVEVFIRKVLNASLAGVDEISGYVFAAVTAWGFAYATLDRAHVRIDSIVRLLPLRFRAVLAIIAQFALASLALGLTYHAWRVLYFSLKYHSTSQTPLGIPLAYPQSIWFLGLVTFTIYSSGILIGSIGYLAKTNSQSTLDFLEPSSAHTEIDTNFVGE